MMRLSVDGAGRVTLRYACCLTGEMLDRTFVCPADGGYVRELPEGHQPCEGLGNRGPTLRCASRADLPELIRSEYRAMRRAEARYWLQS